MIHLTKSLRARKQNWVNNNFSKTKYSKRLKQFKNNHEGETCFIIGNGPSLKAEDLERLHQNNIPTYAFNRIYLIFNNTSWRPTYYISQDEKILKNCQSEVNAMNLEYKFIPLYHKYFYDIKIANAFYFNMKTTEDGEPFFSNDISKAVGGSGTVTCTALQFAAYMGFKKIYLIGVDHNFSTYKNDKGEIITDSTVKDYFTEEYNKDKAELYIPNVDASTRSYIIMKNYCDKHNIEVYNATRGGKLEVFPRVDFDSLGF